MTSLVIDIGNSSIKFGEFELGLLKTVRRFDTLEELEAHCLTFSIEIPLIISSVTNTDLSSLKQYFINSLVFEEHINLPLIIHYQTPQTLGKDRIAAAVGARHLFPDENCLVIDAGTAITYDFVTKSNEFIGGSIAPGMDMKFKALHQFTEKLPLISKSENIQLTGSTTTEAIQSGVMLGCVFEMQGFIDAYSLANHSFRIILTGGDSSYFANRLKGTIFAEPDLVLKGLFEILKYNAVQS